MKRRYQGSVSLLLCLLLPAFLLFSMAALELSRSRLRQADRGRALYGGAELCLAHYDRKLWQQFALWGFNPADVELEVAEQLLGADNGSLRLSAGEPLWKSSELKRQILRQMRLRAPVFLAKSLWQKWQQRHEDEAFSPALRRLHAAHSANQAYLEGQRQLPPLLEAAERRKALPPEEKSDPGAEIREGWNSSLISRAFPDPEAPGMSWLSGLLRFFAKKILPVYEAAGTSGADEMNAFSPSLLEQLASRLDRILDQGVGISNERLLLSEYALHYFPARVSKERLDWTLRDLRTPDGRSLEKLGKERPSEAEILATGRRQSALAEKNCDALILGLRFLSRYLSAYFSPELQARYARWGRWSSTAVAIFSLGDLQLPPEVMQYFVQAADSMILADKDLNALLKGEGLPFWPEKAGDRAANLLAYYRDYLRLILWTRPPDALLQDLEYLIRKACPGDYFCSAQLSWSGKEGGLSVQRAYRDAEETAP